MNVKVIGQVAIGVLILWVVAIMAKTFIGYWGIGIAAVLTVGVLAAGIYIYRLTRKSSNIVEILKGATDAEGRKSALERLRAEAGEEGKDAMNALAQAQLLMADGDAAGAVRTLEAIDLDAAPAILRDEVRANQAALYLGLNRAKDARSLADVIEPDNQPQPKSKAMYVAVVAEAKARTGAADEAFTLLSGFTPDPTAADVEPLLTRARVYAAFHAKKRNLARQQMERLAGFDPQMLGPFLVKGANPELQQMAKQVLQQYGMMPRGPKTRMR